MGCCKSVKDCGNFSLPTEPMNSGRSSPHLEIVTKVISVECNLRKTPEPFMYHRPPPWYFTCPECVRLVDLQPNDTEYEIVTAQFHQTLPNIPIVRIQVVQNKSLYTKFASKHDEVSRAIGRSATITRLFHGSRGTDPKVIYESEFGVNSNLGGKSSTIGTYFAFYSNISAGYAHIAPDGTQEMFLCEVIVENYLPQQSNYGVQQQGVWIAFQPMMNYPHFLISYR